MNRLWRQRKVTTISGGDLAPSDPHPGDDVLQEDGCLILQEDGSSSIQQES